MMRQELKENKQEDELLTLVGSFNDFKARSKEAKKLGGTNEIHRRINWIICISEFHAYYKRLLDS
jgi:hypothetical protein